jgi:hypothetical protein
MLDDVQTILLIYFCINIVILCISECIIVSLIKVKSKKVNDAHDQYIRFKPSAPIVNNALDYTKYNYVDPVSDEEREEDVIRYNAKPNAESSMC